MESKKKKSMLLTPRTDIYLHKTKKEEIVKKNKKRNSSKKIKIKQNIHSIQPSKDELSSHFHLRTFLFEKAQKPNNEKEWNCINSLTECYANQILLQVKYDELVEKEIQQILENKNKNKNSTS
jgi:hypothetical protein